MSRNDAVLRVLGLYTTEAREPEHGEVASNQYGKNCSVARFKQGSYPYLFYSPPRLDRGERSVLVSAGFESQPTCK